MTCIRPVVADGGLRLFIPLVPITFGQESNLNIPLCKCTPLDSNDPDCLWNAVC